MVNFHCMCLRIGRRSSHVTNVSYFPLFGEGMFAKRKIEEFRKPVQRLFANYTQWSFIFILISIFT
jgi:hypothetical protein